MRTRWQGLPAPPTRLPLPVVAGVGLLAALGGALFRLALAGLLGSDLAFLTFYPAVAVAAGIGGLGGGLTAVGGSVVLAWAMVLSARPVTVADLAGGLVFVLAGTIISWLAEDLRRLRLAAETGRDRARFVAEVAKALGEAEDERVTLEVLTRSVVPSFADWCAVDRFDAGLRFTGATIAASDARTEALAHELRSVHPYEADAPAGIAAVARTGRPEVVLEVPDGSFDVLADERLRAVMAGLGMRSYASVPMVLPGGRILGVLTVVMAASGRRFSADDVALAADLARRAAVALDRADLLREATARRDELHAVLAAIPDGVLLADADGRVRFENRASVEAIGPAIGEDLDGLLAALPDVPGRSDLRQATHSGRYVLPRVVRTAAHGTPVRFAMLVDRTAVVETEAARDTFVGMLSHELRTPITTIYAAAQLLRRDPPPVDRIDLVDSLGAETERLLQLVEDLLVLSRYERGRLEAGLEPLMLARVVEAAMEAELATHPSMRAAIDVEPGLPAVLADLTYLRQIVRNLVSNAAKYAGADARLAVRVTRVGDRVRMAFEDDGPGIPPGEADRVFELFERLGRPGDQPGAGIGLFVCRQLAQVMGGTMTARGGPGGACFMLELPVLGPEDGPEPDGDPDAGPTPGGRS